MYRIEAAWEVGKGNRPAHVFYVDGKRAGTTAKEAGRLIQGPAWDQIAGACALAKTSGPVEFFPSLMGWSVRRAA